MGRRAVTDSGGAAGPSPEAERVRDELLARTGIDPFDPDSGRLVFQGRMRESYRRTAAGVAAFLLLFLAVLVAVAAARSSTVAAVVLGGLLLAASGALAVRAARPGRRFREQVLPVARVQQEFLARTGPHRHPVADWNAFDRASFYRFATPSEVREVQAQVREDQARAEREQGQA